MDDKSLLLFGVNRTPTELERLQHTALWLGNYRDGSFEPWIDSIDGNNAPPRRALSSSKVKSPIS
jgi:hypothetical protein